MNLSLYINTSIIARDANELISKQQNILYTCMHGNTNDSAADNIHAREKYNAHTRANTNKYALTLRTVILPPTNEQKQQQRHHRSYWRRIDASRSFTHTIDTTEHRAPHSNYFSAVLRLLPYIVGMQICRVSLHNSGNKTCVCYTDANQNAW